MTSPKIPYRQQPKASQEEITVNGSSIPTWARILYEGVKNKDELKIGLKELKKNPEMLEGISKGLLGQFLLNKYLPNNMDVDLKNRSMNYSTKNNMDIGFSNRGDTNFLNLGWRF